MSTHEWNPGDVAMVTIGTVDFTAIRRYGGWTTAYGHSDIEPLLSEIVAARPLVVLDPEDMDAVCELFSMASKTPTALQAALREFANPTPPKPEEPLGLGAVVESVRGNRYVRAGDGWLPATVLGLFRNPIDWADIAAVRVLSPGYTEGGAS